jgi:hypothetical protein
MKRPYLIANPIYDGVFKALMEDLDIARGFLSAVLGLTIESLRFTSRETSSIPPGITGDVPGITASCTSILRLDFCAVIRTADGGQAQVIIELQKTRLSGDIMRFRHYLATRYVTREIPLDAPPRARPEPLPVLCVYLLGFIVDKRLPLVTRVERQYVDAVSGLPLELPDARRPDFVERLTHDAWFVQIPRIRGIELAPEGTPSERILSVFDQSRMLEGDRHRLDYQAPDAKLDKILARIVRQLHKLQTDPEMERIMSAEDLFEIEQQRIHEDLTQALFESEKLREEERRLREEEQRRREEEQKGREAAEQEISRLRKLLEEATGATE